MQRLANDRVFDAQALLATGRWSGAYYLAGYAVECGLKSCVLAYVERTGVIFLDKRYSEKCWTHGIDDLAKLAGVDVARDAVKAANPVFAGNWSLVARWTETSRYQQWTQAEAEDLFNAVSDNVNGVLQWIRQYW